MMNSHDAASHKKDKSYISKLLRNDNNMHVSSTTGQCHIGRILQNEIFITCDQRVNKQVD